MYDIINKKIGDRSEMAIKTAYFAGGCFWCVTPTFKNTDGVVSVVSGYSGGSERDVTYYDVKSQKTGHRETIKIDYDTEKLTYDELFDIFLCGVDPFDSEGQYIDKGHSYTLAVYYTEKHERATAVREIEKLEREAKTKVHISVEPFLFFVEAEEEHQDYYLKNPEAFERELIESGRKGEKI